MDVRALLSDSLGLPPGLPGDAPVRGLAADSRRVKPGFVFFARPGRRTDGARYAGAALEAGAVAVVAPPGAVSSRCPELVEADDLPRVLGRAADRFHGAPSAEMDVVGITGTNGKTTVAHCVARAFDVIEPGGGPCAVMGTLGHGIPGVLEAAALTTPDVLDVHRKLAAMRRSGVRRVAMEVSSHAIEQGRVAGVRFRVACLTNIGRDHLDYHGSAAAYAAAKRRLFTWPELEAAVINADDRLGRAILASEDGPPLRLGYALDAPDAAVRGRIEPGRPDRTRLEVAHGRRRAVVDSPLVGRFNAYNLLAGLAVLIALNVPLERAAAGLAAAESPRGRLQPVRPGPPDPSAPPVYVDFAHTPDALSAVLASLRPLAKGEIRIVFGCGGERDRGKRPLMGAAAARGADRLFVTSDNPRGEDPRAIIDDILAGTADIRVEIEPDRRRAIHAAVADAAPDDLVLVAGKGHEATQEVGGERRPFDDVEVAREALARRAGRGAG